MQGLIVEITDDTDDSAFLIRSKCLESRADSLLRALESQSPHRRLVQDEGFLLVRRVFNREIPAGDDLHPVGLEEITLHSVVGHFESVADLLPLDFGLKSRTIEESAGRRPLRQSCSQNAAFLEQGVFDIGPAIDDFAVGRDHENIFPVEAQVGGLDETHLVGDDAHAKNQSNGNGELKDDQRPAQDCTSSPSGQLTPEDGRRTVGSQVEGRIKAGSQPCDQESCCQHKNVLGEESLAEAQVACGELAE